MYSGLVMLKSSDKQLNLSVDSRHRNTNLVALVWPVVTHGDEAWSLNKTLAENIDWNTTGIQ